MFSSIPTEFHTIDQQSKPRVCCFIFRKENDTVDQQTRASVCCFIFTAKILPSSISNLIIKSTFQYLQARIIDSKGV